MLASEIGTYSPPGAPAVFGFKEHIGGIEKKMWIEWRKHNRLGAFYAIVTANWNRRDVLNLPRAPVEARDLVAPGAINNVVVQWIRRDIAVLDHADRMPVSKSDFTVIASTGDADRTALLLPTTNFVRESVHDADVIDLRRGLVVPRTPGLAAIHTDQRALIRNQK